MVYMEYTTGIIPMAIHIKGDQINTLLDTYCRLTGQTNKSDAVREALASQIAALSARESLSQRVAKIQAKAAASGIVADGRDDKALMDEMWGGD